MRERSTWQNSPNPRQAATQRRADVYDMNQDHAQPSATEYVNGDPDSWAETPTSNKSVELEYDGDHVKRNEIGLPEFREDTWNHKDSDNWNGKGKYDNQRLATEKRAALAMEIASATLRTDKKSLVEKVAADFMGAPDKVLISIASGIRMASPDSLKGENRFRRSLACVKLASRMLGESGNEELVTKLSTLIASIDDPTLRQMVALVRASQAMEKPEEEPSHTSTEEKPEEKPMTTSAAEEKPEEKPVETASDAACDTAGDHQAEGDPAELAQLEALLHADQAEGAAMQALAEMMQPAANVETASSDPNSDISFADDGSEPVHVASLDELFSDDSEVQAQRQVAAASLEKNARELGFNTSNRTASAKKLGNVTKTASSNPVDLLSKIW